MFEMMEQMMSMLSPAAQAKMKGMTHDIPPFHEEYKKIYKYSVNHY